jgi:uncharacterized peroxidase-related enzyme
LGAGQDLIEALSGSDPLRAPVGESDRELLRYGLKLTRDPAGVTETDVDRLREAGFDDRAIHDACQVIAYFAYVNRVADGLGVELES